MALKSVYAHGEGVHVSCCRWAVRVATLLCVFLATVAPVALCDLSYAADGSSASAVVGSAGAESGQLASNAKADAGRDTAEAVSEDAEAPEPEAGAEDLSEPITEDKAPSSGQDMATNGELSWPWVVFIVCAVLSAVVLGIAIGILKGYQNR